MVHGWIARYLVYVGYTDKHNFGEFSLITKTLWTGDEHKRYLNNILALLVLATNIKQYSLTTINEFEPPVVNLSRILNSNYTLGKW